MPNLIALTWLQKMFGVRSYKPVPELDLDAVTQAAELIKNAENPFIVWGQG